jgi:thioredoxin 1
MSALKQIGDSEFRTEVLESELPVFVDFFATWCGPCHAIAPTVDRLAAQYQGKVKFVKVDVDESPDTASEYGIQGVPTLMVFKGGQVVKRMVGAGSAAAIEQTVKAGLEG